MTGFAPDQPSVPGLIERIADELSAKAVLLLHEDGQVLQRSGWVDDAEYPSLAALVAGMISAGKSLSGLGEAFLGEPSRFACDSDSMGLYTVGVANGVWLAVFFEQPLNPGQFRMKVRRYASLVARLGVQKPEQWELTKNDSQSLSAGATLPLGPPSGAMHREILTTNNSSLFSNITDEEIDELFENARS